jgi:hypothetical protein
MSDTKNTGKQIAIQVGIQIVGSLIAGIILYQFFKPREDDPVLTTAKTAAPKTTVVVTTPEDDQV